MNLQIWVQDLLFNELSLLPLHLFLISLTSSKLVISHGSKLPCLFLFHVLCYPSKKNIYQSNKNKTTTTRKSQLRSTFRHWLKNKTKQKNDIFKEILEWLSNQTILAITTQPHVKSIPQLNSACLTLYTALTARSLSANHSNQVWTSFTRRWHQSWAQLTLCTMKSTHWIPKTNSAYCVPPINNPSWLQTPK